MAQVKKSHRINTSRVLREIWLHREISRIQIAKNLDLDKSTVSGIVTALLHTGIISETAQGEAGPLGGRKPVFLTLNRAYGCVLGIELRQDEYTAVAVNLEGDVVCSRSEPRETSVANIRQAFMDIQAGLRKDLARDGMPVLGVGVGISGIVDPVKGVIRRSIPLRTEVPFDFQAQVADGYDLPLFIENDANACAWGELAFHRVKRLRDFLFLLVEFRNRQNRMPNEERIGVGIGIVIDNRVHYGRTFSAGEFRSVFCPDDAKGQFSLTGEEAYGMEKDPALLSRFIAELSKNTALLVNTFNLSYVFLGGHIERYREQVQTVLADEIQKNWPYAEEAHCKIRFSTHGERAVAYGAAGMVLHHMFTSPAALGRFSGIISESPSPALPEETHNQ